jgi:glutaredoxin
VAKEGRQKTLKININKKYMNTRQSIDRNKYVMTFMITAIIFGLMLYINGILDQKRYEDVKSIQDQISLDLLSSETQFNLLKETSCKSIDDSVLSKELNSLATKLSYLEANQSESNQGEIAYLKKYYSLLQVKDWILMRQLAEKCKDQKVISVLYFYGDKEDCSECEDMSYVLTRLRQQYPELRIYSFDTKLDLGALNTLKTIFGIESTKLPALVYNGQSNIGFKSIDEIKELIPDLKQIDIENAKKKELEEMSKDSENKASTSTEATSAKPRN